jgi:hypothetical protein
MNRKIGIGVVVVFLLIVVAVVAVSLMLTQSRPDVDTSQDGPEMDPNIVQLSGGCNDIVDVSVLPEEKKMELCKDLIESRKRELEERGFLPGDCDVDSFEVVDCDPALGTELICTLRCGEDAE